MGLSTGKKKKNRGRPVRKPLHETLPQVHKTIDLPEGEKFCPLSGRALKGMGEETSKQLDIEPTKTKVIVTHRLKYSCDCARCKAAAGTPIMPTVPVELQPIPKAIAAPGVLAYIALSKYADALPLARQEQIFKRYDIHLNRATIASWMIALGKLVMPLINLAGDPLIKCLIIQADETRIQVRKRTGKRPTAENYMWVLLGEGRIIGYITPKEDDEGVWGVDQ